jgi:RIO kinase 1
MGDFLVKSFPTKKSKVEKRIKDEDLIKVVDSTIDPKTEILLNKVSRKLKIIEILGAISAGKEAKVYPGRDLNNNWYAIKIYYTATASHKRAVQKYTFGDPRFQEIKVSNTKQLISIWARKEFKNLLRMYENSVRVPKPILVEENILVMEFIGNNGIRAPLLKELNEDEITEELYLDILNQLQKMVKNAKLVHGDLSEYNIMVNNGLPYIIDVSQAVTIDHENSIELLIRDINNINNFFRQYNIKIIDVSEVLKMLGIK